MSPHAALTTEQQEVAELVDQLTETSAHGDFSKMVATTRPRLIEAGIWSLAMPESSGGGGGEPQLLHAALFALAGHSASLAWSLAQAHAAVQLLAPERSDLVGDVLNGAVDACVLDRSSESIRLSASASGSASASRSGSESELPDELDRLDASSPDVVAVVLDGDDAAWWLPRTSLTVRPLLTTGFDGGVALSARVSAPADTARIQGPGGAARMTLQVSGAWIAAGLAATAAALGRAYGDSRVQFGGPISAIPVVREALAGQDGLAHEALLIARDADDPSRSAFALRSNCERAIQATTSALQTHGGYGYVREYRIEGLLRDAITLRAATDAAGAARREARH